MGSFLTVGEGAGEGGGGVGFVSHADPFVEHGLGFFFGTGHLVVGGGVGVVLL